MRAARNAYPEFHVTPVNKAKVALRATFAHVEIEIATLFLAGLALSLLVESLVKPWAEVQED